MIYWGEDRVLKDVADPGNLFPITEEIAYDRGAESGNGVVEARMPVAGFEFSMFRPCSEANGGGRGAVAYCSATDMM